MENTEKESYSWKSEFLIDIIKKHFKHFVIIGFATAILAAIFSGPTFITPEYESKVIFFPASTQSISKALLDENNNKYDILQFGEEEQIEQALQILNSDEIADYVIRKYNLIKHYRIDSTGRYPQTKLRKAYQSKITFRKTEFNSVEIAVLDEQADTAALIANDIAARVDTTYNRMQKERAIAAFNIVKNEYEHKQLFIKQLEDSLNKMRSKGVYDFQTQAEVFNDQYTLALASYTNEKSRLEVLSKVYKEVDTLYLSAKARMQGAESKMKVFKSKLDEIKPYAGANVQIIALYRMENENLVTLKRQYDMALVDANQNLSVKFIVNKAYKAEKPTYPIRSLIVIIAFFCSEIITLIIILYKNRGK